MSSRYIFCSILCLVLERDRKKNNDFENIRKMLYFSVAMAAYPKHILPCTISDC